MKRSAALPVILFCCAAIMPAEVPFRHTVIDENAGTNGTDINIVGDINGDGLDDIIEATKGGEVIWFENPSLKRHDIFKANFKWSCEGEIADINGDKNNDIVLVSWYESKHYWLENPGAKGGDWKLHQVGDGIRGHDVEVADLDSDGKLDIIVRSETWPRVQASAKEVQLWRQKGPDEWSKTSFTTTEGGGIKAVDVDRDRDIDVITGGRWYENDGYGGGWAEHILDEKAPTYAKIEFADINGDNRRDIIITPSESHALLQKVRSGADSQPPPVRGERGPVAWYENPGDKKGGAWTKHIIDPDMGDMHTLSIADIDANGTLDIFSGQMHNSEGDKHEIIVYLNGGKGLEWTRQVISTAGTHQGFAFDLGGDGDYDLMGTNYNTNRVEVWENLTKAPGAKKFTFFDGIVEQTGKQRHWENWDFVGRLPVKGGAPKNWVTPVNFADGTLRYRIEVLEMQPVESPVSMHMGWENIFDDPEIRHTAGAPIKFSKPGVYETTVPVKSLKIFYGKGPKKDQRCFDWDWRSAWTENKIYTFIQPHKNPLGKDGFPYKVHATITIEAPE